jgi:hypothetical protein
MVKCNHTFVRFLHVFFSRYRIGQKTVVNSRAFMSQRCKRVSRRRRLASHTPKSECRTAAEEVKQLFFKFDRTLYFILSPVEWAQTSIEVRLRETHLKLMKQFSVKVGRLLAIGTSGVAYR